jgi:tRNA (cytidine/uridine-2'-O-)-methyltransferase
MHIVLVNPEIPQNTGNIARTCAATGMTLHLVKPLGFSLDDKYMKRAGLDYWFMADVRVHESWEDFLKENPGANMYFATTKAPRDYCRVKYEAEDFLVFGRETRGLDEELLAANYERCVRIPMRAGARSLNLSNSVAIMAYEALRQLDFPGLDGAGSLREAQPHEGWADYV